MPYDVGVLVVVHAPGNPGQVVMIGRVVADSGTIVTVRSDDALEREAANEHGFVQPPPRVVQVHHDQLLAVLPRLN